MTRTTAKFERRCWLIQICVSFTLFFCLAGDAVTKFFGGDDVANLYKYCEFPLSHWLMGLVHFWSSDWYRPLGGVVYLALYDTFGFHPLPFKLVLFAALTLNMILYLRFARMLSGSMRIASWALLFCCYHAALNGLYLNFGTIYDILGYTFFFAALLAYIAFCATGRRPLLGLVLVLLSFIAGLCCKEMVVTLPAVMLAYNVILSGAIRTERLRWPTRSGLPIIACSVVAAIYTLGKMTGSASLSVDPAYTPHFTFARFLTSTAHYMHELFYLPDNTPTPAAAILALLVVMGAALFLRSGLMLFSVISAIVTQLPVSFIAPRGGFVVYIPAAFWALSAAACLDAATPLLKRPLPSIVGFLVTAAVLLPLHLHMKKIYDTVYVPQTIAYKDLTKHLDRWNVHLRENGHFLLVNDPFPPNWIGWDPLFLISLRDRTTHATVNRLKISTVFPPESEIAWYDYVVDYDTDWRLLKKAGQAVPNPARLRQIADNAPVLLLDGFDPPSRDGWRPLHDDFALRVKGVSALSISLSAFEPVRLSEQVDEGPFTGPVAYSAGSIHLTVPITAVPRGQTHVIRLRADDKARLIFTGVDYEPAR